MGRSTGGSGADVLRGNARRAGRRLRGLAALLILLLSLQPARSMAATSTLVLFDFGSFGTVQVDLFTQLTPLTVNNFLGNYVSTGAYSNTMIHRSFQPLKIIQGGGYDNTGVKLPASAPVNLEYSYPNLRGTIAMARTQDLNSATREWFFNFKDNSTALGPTNGGGYTAFGQVVGPGMSVIDAIGNLPEYDLDGSGATFDDVPLFNYTQTDYNNGVNALAHLVILNSVSVVKTHTSYQNPFNSLDTNNNNNVNANDAAVVIQDLLLNGIHDLTATFGSEGHRTYVDANGDGKVTAQDALLVVQAVLLGGSASQASVMAEPMATPLAVPEPSSLALAAIAASALLAFGWRKRAAGRRRAA